ADEPEVVGQVVQVHGLVGHRRVALQERAEPKAQVQRQEELPPAAPHDAALGPGPRFRAGRGDVNVPDDPPLAPARPLPGPSGSLYDGLPVPCSDRRVRTDAEADRDVSLLASELVIR